MIPSYQEEIRIRKNKDRLFWVIVAIMTTFLYFFFQGYYPNYERILDRTDTSKQAFLKPFGIIDVHVFPSPDSILINNESYNNNSKTIFDLGDYELSIRKEWYMPIDFSLNITKENPFYSNVVNLLALPGYVPAPFVFRNLSLYNNLLLLHAAQTGSFLLVDTDFQVLQDIRSVYTHIGGLYFTDGNNILNYSLDTGRFLPVIARETGLPLQCTDISYYGDKLFCHDTMRFVGQKTSDIREKILAINDRVVVTPKYIYNQDASNATWKYFEYQTGTIQLPDSVVHINKIPYFFEKGILSPVDGMDTKTAKMKDPDWWMDKLFQAKEFDGETVLFGEKNGKGRFLIIDSEKQYSGIFDPGIIEDMQVHKISGVYVFTTPKAAYVYYKGAKEIVKILDGVDIVRMVDAKIFFNKDGKSYVLDLLRKEVK